MSDISKITLPNGIEYNLKDSVARTDLQDKADKATTLSGYGITNAYTKDEVDSLVVSGGSNTFVQKAGDTMTGALITTELTVGSRAAGSTIGTNSVVSGYDNTASGNYSVAEGAYSTASESYSHAEGNSTLSSGYASHAEGGYTEATLDQSHAEGFHSTASGAVSHAEGNYTTASGAYSHAEGNTSIASSANSHAEGYGTTASGANSHAEGVSTTASKENCHAEGYYTAASGSVSHAEGASSSATGNVSHAEGASTTASGAYSHAEGTSTTASGQGSHAEGMGTIAASGVQHAGGSYNIADNNNTYIEIIGNGTGTNTRSNARTLDWNGNATYAGKVTVGTAPTNNMDLTTKQYVDNIATTIPSAVSELENDVPYLTSDTCDEKTVSDNNLIHIEDAVASSANIKIDLSPVQNFNGYDHAWAAGAGENLLPFVACIDQTRNGITFKNNADGSVHVSGTATAEALSSGNNVLQCDEKFLTWFEAGTYTLSSTGGKLWCQFTNEERATQTITAFTLVDGGSRTVTFNEKTAVYIRADVIVSDGTVDADYRASVVAGSTAPTAWTPYENICTINGYTGVTVTRTGKNIVELPIGTYRGITITRNSDGTYNINGTTTNTVDIICFNYNSDMSLCPFRGNYKIAINGDFTVTGYGGFYASDNDTVRIFSYKTSGTYETTNGIGRIWMYFGNETTVSGDHVQIMAYAADEDDTFEPYTSATCTVIFPVSAGTVYGGEIIINEDGSGSLIVNKGYWKPTSSTATGTMSQSTNGNRCGYALDFTVPANTANILCSCGTPDTNANSSNNLNRVVGHCAIYHGTQGIDYFRFIFPTTITTAADGLQYLIDNNCEIVYELTNPIIYDLTPLQVIKLFNGENNIWTDTNNNIDLTYKNRFTIITPKERNKLNNIPVNAAPNYFGVCSDSGVTRTVTVDSSFTLTEGVMVNVFFENVSTSQATLNVNDTGAYPIYIYGTQPVSNAIAWGWRDNQLIELVFHDSKWWVQNQYFNNAGTTTSGLMTSSHVTKLDSLDPNGTSPIRLTNQDLDDIYPTNTTWYYAGGGNTVTNVPGSWVTSFGMVCFRTAGGYIIQKLWPTSWSYAYSRTWNGTTWSEWRYDAKDATTNEAGFMSTTDKQTLDGLSSIELTNEDLNDLHPLKTTFYWSEAGNTCTHKPTAITVNSFALICLRTTNTWMLQICIHPTSNRQWRRHYNAQANTWSAWAEITYSWAAARTYNGLMSAADKVKLDDLKASTINVTDTYGLCGTAGSTVTIQALMDAIASKV